MSEIIKIDETNIIPFLKTWGSEVGKPFSQKIYLIKVRIAGTWYVDNIVELGKRLEPGLRLNFFREPDNPHDKLAIVVKDDQGNKLGYVPRGNNEILARLMDVGKLIYGIIVDKKTYKDSVDINMQVFMDD